MQEGREHFLKEGTVSLRLRSGAQVDVCLEAAGSCSIGCDKSSRLSNAYSLLNLMIKKVINKT